MMVIYIISGGVQVTYVAKTDMVEESASCEKCKLCSRYVWCLCDVDGRNLINIFNDFKHLNIIYSMITNDGFPNIFIVQ